VLTRRWIRRACWRRPWRQWRRRWWRRCRKTWWRLVRSAAFENLKV